MRPPRNAAANRAVDFINSLSCTGQDKGKPFILRPWQEEFVRRLFGTFRKNKKRQYTSAFLFLSRRQGKSSLAAAIGIYCLFCGPPGQQIIVASTNRTASGRVFEIMCQMVEAVPYLRNKVLMPRPPRTTQTKRIALPEKSSYIEAVAADGDTSRGADCSCLIFDELLTQKTRDLWNVLTTAQASWDEPLKIALTTAGDSRDSLVWDEFDYAKRVDADPSIDPTHLPVLFYAKDDEKWDDEAVWKRCNPALGDYKNIDKVREECAKAKELPYLERTFRQEHLNQFVDCSDVPWVRATDFAACKAEQPCLDGIRPSGAVDLSKTTDLTAFALCWPLPDDRYWLKCWAWIPLDTMRTAEIRDHVTYGMWKDHGWIRTCPGDAIDYQMLRRDLRELFDQYRPSQILWDRWGATYLTQALADDGLPMFEFGQGTSSMSQPTKEFERLVLERKLMHDGNPVLNWCVSNVQLVVTDTELVKPSKRRSYGRIDCAVASIMALAGAMTQNNVAAIYDNRDLLMSLLPKNRAKVH